MASRRAAKVTDQATLTREIDLRLNAEDIADAFCQLDDDAQAQFFVHVAAIMRAWPEPGGHHMQNLYIARHLRDCEFVTAGARGWLGDPVDSMREAKT